MADSAPDLAQLLLDERDRIVARFVAEVQRKDLPPPGLSRPLLVDHMPRLLAEIVEELRRVEKARMSQDAIDTSAVARAHGGQRWGLGYDLEALIREYGMLRRCIVLTAKERGVAISIDEFDTMAKCLSVGVAEAATEYIKYRDAEIEAQRAGLEFLVEAGQVLSGSLDHRSLLGRLTSLIVPRLADCCVVNLGSSGDDDLPIAHTDASKVALVAEIRRRFPHPASAAYGDAAVLRTGEPQLLPEVSPAVLESIAQSPEHLALLRQLGPRSWVVVPLRVQGHMFGALTLIYSDSDRRYTERDLVLVTALANRAAVALDNARLYELSQRERSRVEAATRAKDEFVAMISHELRTPLTAILGWVRLMRSGTLDDAKKAHAFDVIERNAEAQNRLVADLLDVSRTIAGKIRINPAQVNLCDVVDMTVEGVRPAAEAKRIDIQLDLERENGILRADADRLQQVVWNLLVNAVKFTPKSGEVRVRLRRLDSDLELTVEDNGGGIDADFLPHVFESFRQSDSSLSRAHGGLGIGLSIAKHIVELHGGSIDAASPGKGLGSKFTVRLPVSPLVSTTMGITRVPATTPPSATTALPTSGRGLRVLVVDDEPDARELVAYVLERCGMDVRTAGSAAEAMKELEAYTPHVLVSDIGLPDEDGYALIRNLRTSRREDVRSVPAIALTAFARNEDRRRALVDGFNLHMVKPVEPSALVQAVIELAGEPPP